mmetsp:Transcript_2546/g.6071  ORF Transcript_2546/g.6071 Transcript_2546/m.6071 type:complete len:208 (-) Transcript_2546:50-673(-)
MERVRSGRASPSVSSSVWIASGRMFTMSWMPEPFFWLLCESMISLNVSKSVQLTRTSKTSLARISSSRAMSISIKLTIENPGRVSCSLRSKYPSTNPVYLAKISVYINLFSSVSSKCEQFSSANFSCIVWNSSSIMISSSAPIVVSNASSSSFSPPMLTNERSPSSSSIPSKSSTISRKSSPSSASMHSSTASGAVPSSSSSSSMFP